MTNPSAALDQHMRQLNVICLAIVGGVVIFAGVVWYLLQVGGFPTSEALPGYVATLFNLVGLVILLKAYLLPRIFRAPGSDAPEARHLAWHKRNVILGFALREAAAFIALVGALLTGELVGGFAVAALAVLSMLFAWPRRDQLAGA